MFRRFRLSKPPALSTAALLVAFLLGGFSASLLVPRVMPSLQAANPFQFIYRYLEKNTAVSVSSNAFTIDLSQGRHFDVSLTANVTSITFSNGYGSSTFAENWTMFLKQDATGSRTVTGWPAAVKWVGGSAPTATTTANKIDIVACVTHDGGTSDLCVYNQNF